MVLSISDKCLCPNEVFSQNEILKIVYLLIKQDLYAKK